MPSKPPPKLDKDNNPGKAHWCDDHERLECTKRSKASQVRCHAPAVRGMDACKRHNGHSMEVARAKGEAKITAWKIISDGAPTIDYKMAVLGVLQMTWLRLAAYSELLRRQVAADAGPEPIEWSDDQILPETAGLIGHRYGMGGKEGILYKQSEEARALVTLEAAERDRVVKYAKVAHDMGISDRLTSLAEKWGDVVAGRVSSLLDDLNLTPEQRARVPMLVQAHLGSIDVLTMGAPDEGSR